MDKAQKDRLKRARARMAVAEALRAGLPKMAPEVQTVALGVLSRIGHDPTWYPSTREIRFTQNHGRFRCHCGSEATRVTSLRGRCEAHKAGLRCGAIVGHEQRNRDFDMFAVSFEPEVRRHN